MEKQTMFYVAEIITEGPKNAPGLTALHSCKNESEAVELTIRLALEQSDESEEAIREEVKTDLSYADPDGQFSIYIAEAK
jgi:hypothetical protein